MFAATTARAEAATGRQAKAQTRMAVNAPLTFVPPYSTAWTVLRTQKLDGAAAWTHPATAARSSSSANGFGMVTLARACTRCAAGASGVR
jgi:hypothetical protein